MEEGGRGGGRRKGGGRREGDTHSLQQVHHAHPQVAVAVTAGRGWEIVWTPWLPYPYLCHPLPYVRLSYHWGEGRGGEGRGGREKGSGEQGDEMGS